MTSNHDFIAAAARQVNSNLHLCVEELFSDEEEVHDCRQANNFPINLLSARSQVSTLDTGACV